MRTITKLFTLLVLCLIGLQVKAQNVTIEPTTGNLVAALTYEDESGFSAGLSSLWRHEQLALSMTASEEDVLTTSGEVSDPTAAFGKKNGNLIFVSGHMPLFFVVSLPNGYRFTGYEIVLKNDLVGENICQSDQEPKYDDFLALPAGDNKIMRFYEVERFSGNANSRNNYNNANPIGSTVIKQAADDDGVTDIIFNDDNKGKEYKMSRFSDEDESSPLYMGNQLYFRFTKNAFFCGLSIKSFTLYFTAEGTFTAQVKPYTLSSTAVSMLPLPFYTNKIDFGEMDSYEKDGVTYFSYNHENVQDLLAYNYIYQEDALENDAPADVADTKKIYQTRNGGKDYIGLENGVYYVEPPVTINNSSGNPAPIGYRIVGAKINYTSGVSQDEDDFEVQVPHEVSYPTFYISATAETYSRSGQGNWRDPYVYTSQGEKTYYLTSNAGMTENESEKALWFIDNEGYIRLASVPARYLKNQTIDRVTNRLAVVHESPAKYQITDEGQISLAENSNMYLCLNVSYYNNTNYPRTVNYFQLINNGTYKAARTLSGESKIVTEYSPGTVTIPDFEPVKYYIDIYDSKTGEDVVKTITVDGVSDSYDFGLLNNDAIKFAIRGDEDVNVMALVTVDLYLQALDPYIDKMDIVCHDEDEVLELVQTFTADNFRVSGGRFKFYVPNNYGKKDLTFTFRDLYSKYGDNTYYDGSGESNSRYSFVTSPYFQPINGNGNGGLYASNYNPNAAYNNKVFTSTAGNIRFKFNNAENLGNTSGGTGEKFLEEYPFSVANYLNSVDPDAAAGTTPKDAAFETIKLNAAELNDLKKDGIFYVFTADETRWNIAPSKAWQHRFYAYYRMELEVVAHKFTPEVTWKPIYDKTCGFKKDEFPDPDIDVTPAGKVSTDSMWGLSLRTIDPSTNEYFDQGYLTYQEIYDAIYNSLDPDNEEAAATTQQILYVDCNKVYQLLNSPVDSEASETTEENEGSEKIIVKDLVDLKDQLAVNALVFLPANSKSLLDNVAFKTSSGTYHAGKDIVLTDRYPFFTPYEIQVEDKNKAIYTRTVTRDEYGKDLLASVMLPYALSVNSDGVHTNPDMSTIKLTRLAETEFGLAIQEKNNYYGEGYFEKVEGPRTLPNQAYMVVVEGENAGTGNISFVASQEAATITATTGMKKRTVLGEDEEYHDYKYLYIGEGVSNGVDIPKDNVTLYPEGSYAGQIYDRAHSEAIFYFSSNKFYNLYKLVGSKRYLYMYPFRGVYTFDGGTVTNLVKSMNGFDVSFENPGDLDYIHDTTKAFVPDLMVRSGKGYIQFTSDKDQTVNILSLNGTSYSKVTMNAGDSKTISLTAGVYVVNNVKIIVK